MSRFVDLVNQRFGRWLVVRRAGTSSKGRVLWNCICDCGNTKVLSTLVLRAGKSTSCGCFAREEKENRATHGHNRRGKRSKEYNSWQGMIGRTTNTKCINAKDYIERGITVCDRWRSFENFFSDMGFKPSPDMSIDRIDNDGVYELSNCRWGTDEQQRRNKRTNIWIVTPSGDKMILADYARNNGLTQYQANTALRRGIIKRAS